MTAKANRSGRRGPRTPDGAIHVQTGGGNLASILGWRMWGLRLALGAFSGLLLSSAFPPLEWSLAAWFALVPLFVAGIPRRLRDRFVIGYVFGYVHFATCLHWLNEVGFGAGYLLALYCALYPMAWYVLTTQAMGWLIGERLPAGRLHIAVPRGRPEVLLVLVAATCWVGLEWVRGWLLSGFPWNAVGISQWSHIPLLSLTTFTGVAGLSFLVVSVNMGLLTLCHKWWDATTDTAGRRRFSWGMATAAATTLLAGIAIICAPRVSSRPSDRLRVLAIQGDIPQWRFWTEEQFQEALSVYTGLTRLTEPVVGADLVVWPESAVPAPLTHPPFRAALDLLFDEIETPVLMGALVSQPVSGARWTGDAWDPPPLDFNSAVLLDADGEIIDRYDKTHLVPFGEYVPFRTIFPWLVDLIGMGRDLTAGQEFTLLDLAGDAQAGVNICFEDVFPDISRAFTRRGANVLMTLTNDAWYNRSSGSRQHMIHSVFRAAENRRPLLRSGNNSDTCLILPDGRVTGILYDTEAGGGRFVRGTNVYDVPVYSALPRTVYTRFGDWFARLNGLAMVLIVVLLVWRLLAERRQRYRTITGDDARMQA